MTDILIRGMEMPTMEQAYKTLIISYDGKVYEGVHPQPTAKKKEPIAEAVELPPHGDLIDRGEAIIYADERAYDFWTSDDEANGTQQFLKEQPVVVPAERREG